MLLATSVEMPPKDHILAQIAAASQHARGVSLAWHALFLLVGIAVVLGWRPSRRTAGVLMAAPMATVSMVSAATGSSFNAAVFAALTVALAVLARYDEGEHVAVERSPLLVVGGAFALALAWVQPLGVVPCPTLCATIGLALLGLAPTHLAYRLVLAIAGLFYGIFGVLRLHVWLDLGLIAVAFLLASASVHLQLQAARRRVRAMRTVFSVFVLAFAAACGGSQQTTTAPATTTQAPQASAGLPDRDPALAHKLVAEGGVLIDVRSPEEYAQRHIQGAVNVPVDQIESSTDQVSKLTGGDVHKPIVVYCGSGKRAGRAKEALTSHGYDHVTNLGGIDDWDTVK